MWVFDAETLAQQLVRALRGRRSQTALSRRLGYRSNVVYSWESGRRYPTASELFRVVARTGGDPVAAWRRFPVSLEGVDPTRPEGVAAVLAQLRGAARVQEVAERCEVSRFAASRWLRGLAEPRLPDLLRLVEALTVRVVDLVAALVDPEDVPALRDHHREVRVRRAVAFTHPWSQAILRQLETAAYRRRRARGDDARWLARRLGVEAGVATDALGALETAGLVRRQGGRYRTEPVAVDTSTASAEARRQLKEHWADVGRERLSAGADGLFSWAVVAVSEADYERLRALHVGYLHALRQLVDASDPSEVVAVANVQLFRLDR